MPFWAGLQGLAAGMVPGLPGVLGAERANRARAGEAAKDRTFQHAEAENSMRFSERMRNTSWQAGVADMEKAGINPALAYSKGGASAPMGAAGSGSKAEAENTMSGMVASAQQYKRVNAEIKEIEARVRKTDAETDLAKGGIRGAMGPGVDLLRTMVTRLAQDIPTGARMFAQAPHKLSEALERLIKGGARRAGSVRGGGREGFNVIRPARRANETSRGRR